MNSDKNQYTEIAFTDIHDTELYLISVGKREHSCNHIFNSRPSNPIIAYVKSGETMYYVNDNCFPLHSGMIYVIDPNANSYYDATNTDWSIVWVCLAGKDAHKIISSLGLNVDSPIMEIKNGDDVFQTMMDLFSLAKNSYEYMSKLHIKIKLYTLMSQLLENCDKLPHSPIDYVAKTDSFIENNYEKNIGVSDIATTLHINRSYLSRLYKAKRGITIKKAIQERRLAAARKHIDNKKSVSETAFQCGFQDPLYFSKVYKKKYGISPSKQIPQNKEDEV